MLTIKQYRCVYPFLALLLMGCGLTQSVTDGATSAKNYLFFERVNTLHLDITARSALNIDSREENSHPQPVMLRVYQLQDRKSFDSASYEQLVREGETTLAADLLASHSRVVAPGNASVLDEPMKKEAQYVAIVGLFRAPDMEQDHWRLVLARDELDSDKPRRIELGKNTLKLLPEEE
ncbi:type VI secretion system lipoprotein TssJ [Budvicia diplopodorum]|uniref:type VI secretion system lipoprotein TssJ n=1 Tax=Budvicia diplopodorum TaxID=1119056 RepID=UPI001FE4142C|nr:type VI secretion system lipoprotein TssJ [Budvicia diplopodorum]